MKINKRNQLQLILIITISILIITILFPFPEKIEIVIGQLKDFIKYEEKDEITLYETRFKKLRRIIPEHGVVGYYTNKDYSNVEYTKFFYLTQYVLAPVIVLNNTKQQLIVANVNESFNTIEYCKNNNFKLLYNSGEGLMLFSKKEK